MRFFQRRHFADFIVHIFENNVQEKIGKLGYICNGSFGSVLIWSKLLRASKKGR